MWPGDQGIDNVAVQGGTAQPGTEDDLAAAGRFWGLVSWVRNMMKHATKNSIHKWFSYVFMGFNGIS